VVDLGGEDAGNLVERCEQRRLGVHVFLAQRGAARRLRLGDLLPEFLLLGDDRLEQAIEFRHEDLLLRESDGGKHLERVTHGGHFHVAKPAQIFVHFAIQRLVGVQQPVGRRAVAAKAIHGLEHVGRSVRDDRHPVGQLQALPGVPGSERKAEDNAKRGGQDHCLEQRGYGETVQHGCPPKFPEAISPKNG